MSITVPSYYRCQYDDGAIIATGNTVDISEEAAAAVIPALMLAMQETGRGEQPDYEDIIDVLTTHNVIDVDYDDGCDDEDDDGCDDEDDEDDEE